MQVYSLRQAKSDIEAIYSMGLFDDVSIRPQPAEGSTLEQPKVRWRGRCPCEPSLPRAARHSFPAQVDLSLEIKERKTGGLSAGGGISASGVCQRC